MQMMVIMTMIVILVLPKDTSAQLLILKESLRQY